MRIICTLDDQTRNTRNCKNCVSCGFNLEEQKRRQKMIAENQFTVRYDGLKRLVITRKASEE